ncbi:MAG: URC4/urg3 family protein [Leptolyngbyaceae cyanobacterium SL_5_9]|nr:URC4/urg3 family protein [Leptolyngbyaceae cyanobacterium SM1_4_3]NJN57565.1 URC4/urg3 family protein [Leptolyngbyaceae cyanobacterium SL_5_9]
MSTDINTENLSTVEREAIAYLRSPEAIRERCGQLFDLAREDQLQHFRCDLSRLESVADYVIQVTQQTYPDLQIPFHSRWRHFEVGTQQRLPQLDQRLAALSPVEKAEAKFDLAMTSVLLDAGAGAVWRYVEPETGEVFRRSEGLAIASFDLFCDGLFCSDRQSPQADAIGLQQLTESELAQGFQVTAANPLVGLQGRLRLLQNLGKVLSKHPELFGTEQPRPGHLVRYLMNQAVNGTLPANAVLQAVLVGLGEIWAGRVAIAHVNLGDVWVHSALRDTGFGSHLVPFHKLSQWLTYSLLEPLQELGLEITGLNQLTGLPEYRNGGLCLDLGLLQAKHAAVTHDPHLPQSEVIVEWRSLTVILLDQIAAAVRAKLAMDETALPLVKVLQGGTWSAGRQIAANLRGGSPPIQLESDGTVF